MKAQLFIRSFVRVTVYDSVCMYGTAQRQLDTRTHVNSKKCAG